jgi:hypothetical protein
VAPLHYAYSLLGKKHDVDVREIIRTGSHVNLSYVLTIKIMYVLDIGTNYRQ